MMLSDVVFCIEYVQRLVALGPVKTKTNIEMKKIVIDKIRVDPSTLFSDESLNSLFKYNYIHIFVYSFIRDNQELFV